MPPVHEIKFPGEMPDSERPARAVPDSFLVAFSFAGEQRDLVSAIAHEVEKRLGRGTVFYDEWFEHYLAGADADLKLQNIYGQRCALAVVCVSQRYGGKPWTLAEHEAVRARQMKARASKDKRDREAILPIRVGDGDVEGILFNAIVPDCRSRSAADSAILIVDRLRLVAPDLTIKDVPAPEAGYRGITGPGSSSPPAHLHYLCDRDEQMGALHRYLADAKPADFRRPVLVVVHGGRGAAHSIFVERLCEHELPGRLHGLGFAGRIERAQPPTRLTSRDSISLAKELREKITGELQFEMRCEDDKQLIECFRKTRAAVLAPVFDFSSREAFAGDRCYIEMLRDYWSEFPDLPPGLAVVCFLNVKYVEAPPAGFFAKLFSRGTPDAHAKLRTIIAQLGSGEPETGGVRVIHKVLDELGPVYVEHVERWFNNPQVARAVRERLQAGAIQSRIFKGLPAMPMEDVLEALEDFISH